MIGPIARIERDDHAVVLAAQAGRESATDSADVVERVTLISKRRKSDLHGFVLAHETEACTGQRMVAFATGEILNVGGGL